jgi:hypothetical protein
MKFTADRPFADPDNAACKLLEIANNVEVVQDGRVYIELINGPFLYREKGTPAEYEAGFDLAIERGWLELRESGTFVRLTQGGADLVAFTVKDTAPRVGP